MFFSKIPAFLNVVDIAGLVKGAHNGQGLGNAFLSHISACDGIFHLTRKYSCLFNHWFHSDQCFLSISAQIKLEKERWKIALLYQMNLGFVCKSVTLMLLSIISVSEGLFHSKYMLHWDYIRIELYSLFWIRAIKKCFYMELCSL